MGMALVLLWLPIILAVGIGGRLLTRSTGYALGLLCALFWLLLLRVTLIAESWQQVDISLAIAAGALAIIAMGGWAGELSLAFKTSESKGGQADVHEGGWKDGSTNASVLQLANAIDRFDDWLSDDKLRDPWGGFDQFVRTVLFDCCAATRVKPYRLCNDGQELQPLHENDPNEEYGRIDARRGVVGHVVTTGRSYVKGLASSGELVDEIACENGEDIAWCFVAAKGNTRLGVITVGQLGIDPASSGPVLRAIERVVGQFWRTLVERIHCQEAVVTDPASGLLSREAFFHASENALKESYATGEPVAVAVFGLERLRELNDAGHWEVADDLVREVASVFQRKVRLEDCVGRYSNSRFIVLFRRVDSGLAALIASQILSRVEAVCANEARWKIAVQVRCGIVGSGNNTPGLNELVTGALQQCQRARTECVGLASDLDCVSVSGGVSA